MTPSEKVRSEAAFWVERMNRPAFDAKDGAAFDAWMRSHAEHREAFAAMAAMWDDGFPKIDAIANAEPTEGPVLPAKRRRPGKRLGIAATLVGFATAALIALAFVPATLPRSYSSQPGQPAMIRLADGSTVRLGGNSQIEVQYLPWRRTVRLARGEAGFEVAHDRRRPFGVDAGEVDVVVLGTAFFVDRLANGRVGVAVTRGAVAVRTPGSADRLGPGQAVRVTERGIERVAMQLEDSQWSSGWFVARNIPLSDLIEKLRRYSTEPIVLSDTRLENRMIVGRFKISSPDTVLKGIESSYNLNISRKSGSIHIRSQN